MAISNHNEELHAEEVLAVAHHEAAHIVVACVLGLKIGMKGTTVNGPSIGDVTGVAWFEGATPGTFVEEDKVDDVIVALLAGGRAHRRFKENVETPTYKDRERIVELCDEPPTHPPVVPSRCEPLMEMAELLVTEHWEAIKRVASALCAKQWHYSRKPSQFFRDKTLSGNELVAILAPMSVEVDDAMI